jgi:hypothetical protein
MAVPSRLLSLPSNYSVGSPGTPACPTGTLRRMRSMPMGTRHDGGKDGAARELARREDPMRRSCTNGAPSAKMPAPDCDALHALADALHGAAGSRAAPRCCTIDSTSYAIHVSMIRSPAHRSIEMSSTATRRPVGARPMNRRGGFRSPASAPRRCPRAPRAPKSRSGKPRAPALLRQLRQASISLERCQAWTLSSWPTG